MSSYWASSKAKRRRVKKLVRDTQQDILSEYNLMAANSNHESTHPTFEGQLRGFSTTSDFSLNTHRVSSNQQEDANLCTTQASDSDYEVGADEIEPDPGSGDDEPNEDFLKTSLKYWATSYSVSLVALSALLSILRVFHPTLPKDARTLLGTQTSVPTTKIEGGEYYHFGIVQGVLSRLKCLSLLAVPSTLVLQFNIDGLPLFKSSKLQFWPILGCLKCDYTKSPFLVGVFCGVGKPKSVFQYLEQFIGDLKNVLSNGIRYLNKQFEVKVSSFICDAPARAFIKQTKAHNGYSGCDKCFQEGVWRNKMTFPETKVRLRTDSSFTDRVDEEHHIGNSPLSGVVKMVSMFPIDYMHACCLGVTRKLLNLWLKGKDLRTRLPSQTEQTISEKLIKLCPYMPCEFNRKPRVLGELDRWKATEFRSFMLYWGPVVLKDCLPSEMYDNFMLFSVAMYLLLSIHISVEKLSFAERLMVSFVEHFGKVYGKDEIVYNVHILIHLAEEYRQFGSLDNISGFPFENYLGQVKRLLRKPHQPLQQVVKRLSEIQHIETPHPTDVPVLYNIHTDGPVPPQFSFQYRQYKKVSTYLLTLSSKMGDNCILVADCFALVENIVQTDEDVYIIYRRFRNKQPYYMYPCDSAYIGIYKVSGLHNNVEIGKLSCIKCKCLLCPDGDGAIATPLLHFRV